MKKDKSIAFQIYDSEPIEKDVVVSEFDYWLLTEDLHVQLIFSWCHLFHHMGFCHVK